MAHYGTLRDYRPSEVAADDIRGSHVYGTNDDKLGKIDDIIFDHTTADIRYVVVDTGGWLSSKKFLVPTERIHASSQAQRRLPGRPDQTADRGFPPVQRIRPGVRKELG